MDEELFTTVSADAPSASTRNPKGTPINFAIAFILEMTRRFGTTAGYSPANINGLTVTSIEDDAFYYCAGLIRGAAVIEW